MGRTLPRLTFAARLAEQSQKCLFYPAPTPPGSFLLTLPMPQGLQVGTKTQAWLRAASSPLALLLVLVLMWLWDKTDWNTDLAGNRRARIPPSPHPRAVWCLQCPTGCASIAWEGGKPQRWYRDGSEIDSHKITVLWLPPEPLSSWKSVWCVLNFH